MIDPDTARTGCQLLATAIAELMEDGAHQAATTGHPEPLSETADILLRSGQDIITLAAAMLVLARVPQT